MLGLGYPELIVIGLVALVVIGPRRLPGLLRQAGKVSAQVRRAANEFRRELEMAAEDEASAAPGKDAPRRDASPGGAASPAGSQPAGSRQPDPGGPGE